VSIEPGQRLDGVRIREPRAPTTTATVSLPYDGEFLRDASLRVFDADSRLRGRPAEATVSRLTDRTFAIDDLPAGRFQVVASAGVPSGDRLSVRETIVSDGRTPLSLRLAWAHGVDVSGQVRAPDDLAERDLTGTSLRLMLRGGENARLARLESGGRFRAVGLAPGEYALVAARGLAVVAVTHGGRTLPGSVISVGAGAIEDLVVHLAQRARSLDVDVRDAAGQPTSDAVVALYPADVDRWFADGLPRFGRPSTAGRASFGNIPPGDYRIAAVRTLDPPWRRNWADPVLAEELEPASVPVTLQPGERRKLTVTVR
jgi:hypothetical protein